MSSSAPVRRRIAPLLPLLLLSACQPGVLDPQGSVGIQQRQILVDSLAIMLAIVVPTILATLGFAWWFRSGNAKARHLPNWTYSGRIELVVWGIPALTVLLLSGVTWIGAHQLDPAVPLASDRKALEVQVVSLDWKWLFIYPDQQVATVNTLTVPAGTPVHFSLTSASVMNSFFIPQLGSQIYTMSGMTSQLNLVADHPGEFAGISAHFSGDGFSDMNFRVHSVLPERFEAWVAETRGRGETLDEGRYKALAVQSSAVAPMAFGSVDPALFGAIVTQRIPPADGPRVGPGGVATAENAGGAAPANSKGSER